MKAVCLSLLLAMPTIAAAQDLCLRHAIDASGAESGLKGQIVVSALTADGDRDTRVLSAPGQEKLVGNEGFRIASITKTFVAATVLKLWEDGRIDLEAPITRWLPASWTQRLAGDGYRPEKMTVRHLLSHTSGLADHAQAKQFIATIKADPATEWSRARDIARLVEWTDPMGTPGEKFAYSDTGYLLLGAIVEEITGQDLPDAVRAQLGLDRLGLKDTYWERYEPARGRVRAHQMFEGDDTYAWNPSLDLFGGGGLVASTADIAAFFDALLQGRVFSKPATLQRMLSAEGLPAGSPYRLGLFDYDLKDAHGIGHSGFWGTLAMRDPVSGRTVAGAVTDIADYRKLKQLVEGYVRTSAGPEAAAAGCK
ncbi:MAG TPA: serine hydrolase domain-containing protein [Luteimonas sp.]|nr:serine hydrolase domain-containing protein [Luteimonas sp.]